jgi:hypothetical protein
VAKFYNRVQRPSRRQEGRGGIALKDWRRTDGCADRLGGNRDEFRLLRPDSERSLEREWGGCHSGTFPADSEGFNPLGSATEIPTRWFYEPCESVELRIVVAGPSPPSTRPPLVRTGGQCRAWQYLATHLLLSKLLARYLGDFPADSKSHRPGTGARLGSVSRVLWHRDDYLISALPNHALPSSPDRGADGESQKRPQPGSERFGERPLQFAQLALRVASVGVPKSPLGPFAAGGLWRKAQYAAASPRLGSPAQIRVPFRQ